MFFVYFVYFVFNIACADSYREWQKNSFPPGCGNRGKGFRSFNINIFAFKKLRWARHKKNIKNDCEIL